MFSCWSISAAPIADSAMTIEMTCRCFDSRSMRQDSFHATLFFSPVDVISLSPTCFERASTVVTIAMHPAIRPALTSSKLSRPTRSTVWRTRNEAASPPSAAPPPMNPKKRLACRGS